MGLAGRAFLALAALSWAPWEASASEEDALISQEDVDFAESMKALDDAACSGISTGSAWLDENDEMLKEAIEATSADDSALKAALTTGEDFSMEDYVADIMSSKAVTLPLYLAIIAAVAGLVTCCQARCQCCRCRSKKRVFGKRVKFAIWAGLAVLCFVIAYEGVYKAFAGVAAVVEGIQAFVCGATELAHVTLNGDMEDPGGTFPGTVATLRDMELVRSFIADPSSVEGMDDVIADIGPFYKDAVAISAVLDLLNGLHKDLFHESHGCGLCEEMDSTLKDARSEWESSDNYKLSMAVLEWPPADDKEKLLDSIQKVTAPLQKLQTQMTDVGAALSGNIDELVNSWLPMFKIGALVMTVLTIGFALILVCCGCTSAYLFTFRETVPPKEREEMKKEAAEDAKEDAKLIPVEASDTKKESFGKKEEDDEDEYNPYNPRVHYWAHRTWCWGFCYCVVTLLVGAFTSAVLVPVTETCELLVALKKDANAVDNFGSAVGKEEEEQMKRLVQGCVIDHDSDSPQLLMDLMGTPGADEEFVTLRTTLARDVEDEMEKLFEDTILKWSKNLAAGVRYGAVSAHLVEPLMDIFTRGADELKNDLANGLYDCPVFGKPMHDGLDGTTWCDTKDSWVGGVTPCLLNGEGSDYEAMVMKSNMTYGPASDNGKCDRDKYVTYLKEFDDGAGGGRLGLPLTEFDKKVEAHANDIYTGFNKVKEDHLEDFHRLARELSDKTDCRYIGTYYKMLVGGLCTQTVVGINDIIDASLLSGYLAMALTIGMYLLWRMALDNYDHHSDLAPAEAQKALEEEERLRKEADRSGWVLTSGLKDGDKGVDQSLIPESVRQAQNQNDDDPFDDS